MRRKIILSLIVLIAALLLAHASYAAVEIVPSKSGDGKDAIVNTTVSNSYLLCQGMKDTGGSLKGATVQPHLATNKDWGAVSYLSNSIYGTNTAGGNNGLPVTINGVNYYSTTTNITGVMNWGSNPNKTLWTQTSGLISNYNENSSNLVTELFKNRNTKYVEYIDPTTTSLTKGMAMQETSGKFATFSANTDTYGPGSARNGLFGGGFGWVPNHNWGFDGAAIGHAHNNITFRPVVWN